MTNLRDKTVFITGASRGIGRAIALRAARDGANVVVAAKTVMPHPKLPGTIHIVAQEIEAAGGKALPVALDIRSDEQIAKALEQTIATFGGIDILVNNASAISLTGTLETPMKRFDLLFSINVRGTYACSRACLPWLKKARNPHILNLAPPLNMDPRWFRDHCAYTMSKYAMSMCVLGMAEEFKAHGIAVNALWPRTVIHTAALSILHGRVRPEQCRQPQIVADAAHAILTRASQSCSGNFFLDEQVLEEIGISDLQGYAVDPTQALMPDLFVD